MTQTAHTVPEAVAAETPYGGLKRYVFVREILKKSHPHTLLDVGCGTGVLLTRPLALEFPDIQFLGIDLDTASIHVAHQAPPLPNLTFERQEIGEIAGTFDLVVASEVLEHVEDPAVFIAALRQRLSPSGRLVLTLPNGYGPMEMATFFENLLRLSGLFAILRFLVRLARRRPSAGRSDDSSSPETAAISPHVNFFSFPQLRRLFASAGLRPIHYRPRTVFCGLGFDQIIGALGKQDANARLADRLPFFCASDWMFVLEPCEPGHARPYRRPLNARLRRWLNEKRWGLR
jgi:SAM-dependent methyltransferase